MKRWRRACALAGCPGSIPHDLRRSAVPTFAWAGVTEHVVMKLSGHKTPSVFRRHNTISASDLSEAAEKLDAANPHSIVTVAHSAGPGAVRTARFYWGIWLRGPATSGTCSCGEGRRKARAELFGRRGRSQSRGLHAIPPHVLTVGAASHFPSCFSNINCRYSWQYR